MMKMRRRSRAPSEGGSTNETMLASPQHPCHHNPTKQPPTASAASLLIQKQLLPLSLRRMRSTESTASSTLGETTEETSQTSSQSYAKSKNQNQTSSSMMMTMPHVFAKQYLPCETERQEEPQQQQQQQQDFLKKSAPSGPVDLDDDNDDLDDNDYVVLLETKHHQHFVVGPVDVDACSDYSDSSDSMFFLDYDMDEMDLERELMGYALGFEPRVIHQVPPEMYNDDEMPLIMRRAGEAIPLAVVDERGGTITTAGSSSSLHKRVLSNSRAGASATRRVSIGSSRAGSTHSQHPKRPSSKASSKGSSKSSSKASSVTSRVYSVCQTCGGRSGDCLGGKFCI